MQLGSIHCLETDGVTKIIRLLRVAAVTALLPVHAYAADPSANRLLPGCKLIVSPPTGLTYAQAVAAGECLGMMHGMIETLPILEQLQLAERTICVPERVTNGQLAQVVIKYIEANPANMHRSFVAQAFMAFLEAWPCNKQPPNSKRLSNGKPMRFGDAGLAVPTVFCRQHDSRAERTAHP